MHWKTHPALLNLEISLGEISRRKSLGPRGTRFIKHPSLDSVQIHSHTIVKRALEGRAALTEQVRGNQEQSGIGQDKFFYQSPILIEVPFSKTIPFNSEESERGGQR